MPPLCCVLILPDYFKPPSLKLGNGSSRIWQLLTFSFVLLMSGRYDVCVCIGGSIFSDLLYTFILFLSLATCGE